MPTMDVFNSEAFSLVNLTTAVNKMDHLPTTARQLVDFDVFRSTTVSIAIEQKKGDLNLVPSSERGTPASATADDKRDIRDVRAPRLALRDRIMADEVQNVRSFGTENQLETVANRIMERARRLREDIELTWENMALGAIQGVVPDADGSTLYDWYSIFNVSQPTEFAYDFANVSKGGVAKKTNEIKRAMMREAKGAMGPGTEVFAFCGDNFYDNLVANQEVRETYLNNSARNAEELRNRFGLPFEGVRYQGVFFINYRGTDDNSTVAIGSDKAKFFPVGARGVFEVAFAPGETEDTVNTPGQEMYAFTIPDRDRRMYTDLEMYSYPLFMCKRPLMLQSARRGS